MNNPIPALALEEIFPGPRAFGRHVSRIHGPAHVGRVICQSFRMVRDHATPEYMVPAWVAAYLHDLARNHDDECALHGGWAVDECWDPNLPLFRRAGLTPEWDERVKMAVTNHCQDFNLDREHPAWMLAALLKDSDAMDRYRLGRDERPNPKRLRLERSPAEFAAAKDFFQSTGHDASWKDIWEASQACLFCRA